MPLYPTRGLTLIPTNRGVDVGGFCSLQAAFARGLHAPREA